MVAWGLQIIILKLKKNFNEGREKKQRREIKWLYWYTDKILRPAFGIFFLSL